MLPLNSILFRDPTVIIELCASALTLGYLAKLIFTKSEVTEGVGLPKAHPTSAAEDVAPPRTGALPAIDKTSQTLQRLSSQTYHSSERHTTLFEVGSLVSLPKRSLRGQKKSKERC